MAKKIQLEFDIDSKSVKVAGDEVLSLTQQLKIFRKELQNPELAPEKFEILRGAIGDTEDAIAKTSVRSQDFFNVLSTIPGPIGGIASSLSGAIDTLKVFSGFSLKDIQNSFTDVIDDVKNIVKGFLGLTDATKKQTVADQQLTTATKASTTATTTQTVATNALTLSERIATIATNALKLAMQALPFVAIITALSFILPLITKWINGTEDADAANESLTKTLEEQKKQFDNNLKSIDDLAKSQTLRAKIAGKTEEELFQIIKDAGKEKLAELRRQEDKLYKDRQDVTNNLILTEEQRTEQLTKIREQLRDNGFAINKQINDNDILLQEQQLKIAEESRQKAKEIQTKREQDLKSANEKLRALQQEFSVLSIEDERQKALKQLEIQKQNEELAINQLKISREKRNELLIQLDSNFRIKSQQVNKKFDEEETKSREEFVNKIRDFNIRVIKDETQKNIALRQKQFDDEIAQLKKTDEFKKLNRIGQAALIVKYEQELQDDLSKIREEGEKKRLDKLKSDNDGILQLISGINERLVLNVTKTQSKILNLTDTLGAYYDNQLDLLIEYVDKFGEETLRNKYDINSLKDLYVSAFESNRKAIFESQAAIEDSFKKGLISQDEYRIRTQENNDLQLQNRQQFQSKIIELDNILLDARRQNADATIQIAENVAGLLSAVAGKSIKGQKQAAIADALVSIARVIIDTQRANVAFTASVAPLGPAGVPLATAYTLKNQISAALAIATITAQGISRIKQIDENAAAEGAGGQQSNRLGRGYAEGGLIGGKRHSQGGTIIEAERGEAIMTRGAVTMFAPLLSMMNQMGGGVSFSSNMNTARPDMPVVNNPASEQPLIVKTYVVENEMTSTQQKQARLKDLSTL